MNEHTDMKCEDILSMVGNDGNISLNRGMIECLQRKWQECEEAFCKNKTKLEKSEIECSIVKAELEKAHKLAENLKRKLNECQEENEKLRAEVAECKEAVKVNIDANRAAVEEFKRSAREAQTEADMYKRFYYELLDRIVQRR